MRGISITFIARTTSKDSKNVSIYLNIRVPPFSPKRIASGISVPSKNFTRGSIVGTGKSLVENRNRLEMIKEKIEEAYYIFINEGKIPNPELLLQYVENSGQEAMTVLKLSELILEQKKSDLNTNNCTPALVEKFKILNSQLIDFITTDLKKNDVFLEEVNFNCS